MMIQNLGVQLDEILKEAEEVYIAVALMKDNGLDFILNRAKRSKKINFLLGINLPTSPSVLNRLIELVIDNPTKYSVKIHKTNQTFHPKVYLAKYSDGICKAIIGSANATGGGLEGNIEMGFLVIDESECKKLLKWYNSLFNRGTLYDKKFVIQYEKTYLKNRILESSKESNLDSLLNRQSKTIPGLGLIVKNGQFFDQNDFDAFSSQNHLLKTTEAKSLRKSVRNKLLDLDQIIFKEFGNYGLDQLYHPENRREYTSQYFHSARSNPVKDAIWLHYGKSPAELASSKFTDNIRIQVILRNTPDEAYIGIWLYLGKRNGSVNDRSNLQKNLENELFVTLLYDRVKNLDFDYEIWITDKVNDIGIAEIISKQHLTEELYKDDFSGEFIIGRNYEPNCPAISEQNIKETILIEFYKLYGIYELIKFKESKIT